jgi:hypothetical protein
MDPDASILFFFFYLFTVCGVIIIGLLVLWFYRRKRRATLQQKASKELYIDGSTTKLGSRVASGSEDSSTITAPVSQTLGPKHNI